MVTLVHSPELCLAREEFLPEFKRWFEGMDDLAKRLSIRIHEVYANPIEHTTYFILEADDYKDVVAFFPGIMGTNHTGRISPVVPRSEIASLIE